MLDAAARRIAPDQANVLAIDLGFEPPLGAGARRHVLDERRRVSLRWFSATVLTGVFGASFLGLAVFGALDVQGDAVERPDLVRGDAVRSDGAGRSVAGLRKGDKLVRAIDLINAKQTFRTPTTSRAGDKEVIRVHAFARAAGPLALTPTSYHDDVPVFNPIKTMADSAVDRTAEAPPAQDESSADVSFVSRALAGYQPLAVNQALLSEEEAAQQAQEALAQPARSAPAPFLGPQSLLARTMRPPGASVGAAAFAPAADAAFSNLDVRMVPENVTVARKSPPPGPAFAPGERIVTVKRGETAEATLRGAGVPQAPAHNVIAALTNNGRDHEIVEGQRLKLLFLPLNRQGAPRELARAMLYAEDALEAVAAVNDAGAFVAVAPPADEKRPAAAREEAEDDEDGGGLKLFNSLYETALRNEVPKPVIEELVRVFSYDIDFEKRVAGGDIFDVLYSEDDDGEIAKGEVLFTALTVGGETRRYYRYQTPDDGLIDYYDENGRSAKKFLIRKPIADGQLTSGFGYRRHPILGYSRPHTGVDWANRVGTPILAAGNGTVIKAEWDSGYGKRIEIQHVNGYVTTYSHQTAFARGITAGVKVRQGQVIGYLGSTGLATGPHLHYEVIVNDNFVDPMRIKLPRGRELDGRMLAEFRRERDRIDGLLQKAPNQVRVADQSFR